MNIIKGMDRIALVLAIIALLPGFVLGDLLINENLKTLTPEYREWQKTQKKLEEEGHMTDEDRLRSLQTHGRYFDKETREKNKQISIPTEYQYPPSWQCILGGLLSASLSFVAVLYGLRGMTRGIRWFALWIIEGFRDEKTQEPDKRR